jgi:3',5'-cyclic AMP phosphodiesterase CpdA
MSSRRVFLGIACLALVAWTAGAWNEPVLEFIHVTDTHVLDLERADGRLATARKHFTPSARTLPAFLEEVGNRLNPAFFLITGDLIDAFRFTAADGSPVYGQVEAFRRATERSPAPLYLALGNHDVANYDVNPETGKPRADQSGAGEARAAWVGAAECFRKGTWYSFERRAGETAYRFLVLDNGYTAAIAPEQLHWLRREAARQDGRTLILAMHIPLSDNAVSRAVKEAAAEARIALVLAGHRHSDGVEEIALGTAPAVQVRTAAFGYGVNHWRLIRLAEDRIEVSATGDPGRVERTIAVAAAVR